MTTLILNAKLVNEGKCFEADVLIKDKRIEKIAADLQSHVADCVVDAAGLYLLPGLIDDQVHFREPGLTHKGTIYSESRAAVAGGITSFMEMPNTKPLALTQALLEDKYRIAAQHSAANYSFFIGASNDNLDEAMKTNLKNVCGLKIFMGSSTGGLLVDDEKSLENFFSRFSGLIAAHCEDESMIRQNLARHQRQYGEAIPPHCHPAIRSAEACYASSSRAVSLAKKWQTRLHILHISTAAEVNLFDNALPIEQKKITAEACAHHLWFTDQDYARLGNMIKWNPAIKTSADRDAVLQGLLTDKIDVLATDHAPHTTEEKNQPYLSAPSGGPLAQHALPALLELCRQRKITLEKIVEKACHHPAVIFKIENRGFLREGYFADLVLVDLENTWTVTKENILSLCGWSPFVGQKFHAQIMQVWVSGRLAYRQGNVLPGTGDRLAFDR